MSIGALLGMPASHCLFQRAILQSGAASNVTTRSKATHIAQALLAKLGLETSQLLDVPLEALLKVQSEVGDMSSTAS
jgi:para-nitrobenzyl esterase